jgi:Tol biopolymer transport system component
VPAAAGRDDRIAAYRDRARGIVVLSASGGAAGRLPALRGAFPLGWSRDGTRFLYSVRAGLVLARGDGSGGRRLRVVADYAALSPDGRRVALARQQCAPWPCDDVENPTEIFVLDVRTGAVRRLTRNQRYDGEPTWSPDGRTILFSREQGLYTMSPDGRGLRRLGGRAGASNARWSPDGRAIVFDDFRDLFLLDVRTRRVTRLTRNPGPDHMASWSPDGTRLAYLSLAVCARCFTAHDPAEVWVMDLRTRATRRISGKGYLSPVWMPAT